MTVCDEVKYEEFNSSWRTAAVSRQTPPPPMIFPRMFPAPRQLADDKLQWRRR